MNLILKDDFVIKAGTVFVKGPAKREYSGTNFDAVVSISKDETAEFTVYWDEDTKKLFDVIGERAT